MYIKIPELVAWKDIDSWLIDNIGPRYDHWQWIYFDHSQYIKIFKVTPRVTMALLKWPWR